MVNFYTYFLFVAIGCLTVFPGYGQEQDTSYLLETVQVTDEVILLSDSRQLDSTLTSLYPIGGVQQLLAYSNAAAVRSYGPGLLNTASINGLAAQHTAIVWEGFNLQSSMNGVLDLGLIPLFQDQRLSLAEGGRSASLGSGAMGGALILGSKRQAQADINLAYQFSGISRHQSSLDFSLPSASFRNRTRLFFTYQENRFSFLNTTRKDDPEEKTTPSPGRIGGIQQHLSFSEGSNDLSLDLWYQAAERQLRPSLIAADPGAGQGDEMLNMALNWKKRFKRALLNAKSGYFLESIHYRQKAGNIQTLSKARRWVNRIDYQRENPNRFSFKTGLQYSLAAARSEAFQGNPQQQQLSGFTGLSFPIKQWDISAHLRANHLFETGEWNWAAEIHANKDLGKWGDLGIRLSRDFRIPTLNDLYWTPGGNPNLAGEYSHHASIRWKVDKKINASNRLSLGLFPYHYLVDNWILWRPNPETGIWQPENLQRVWSRGLEGQAGWSQQLEDWNWELQLRYRWGKATVEESVSPGQKNKQLIYTPIHQGSASLKVVSGGWRLQYLHQGTGRRYTSSDNRDFLPAYQLGAIHLQRKWRLGEQVGGMFQLSVENIWNVNYQSIAYFPEPLRYFRLGVQMSFSPRT